MGWQTSSRVPFLRWHRRRTSCLRSTVETAVRRVVDRRRRRYLPSRLQLPLRRMPTTASLRITLNTPCNSSSSNNSQVHHPHLLLAPTLNLGMIPRARRARLLPRACLLEVPSLVVVVVVPPVRLARSRLRCSWKAGVGMSLGVDRVTSLG